ncbi:ABC transporter permease [Phytoactinopolyspora mesophila]|uniref:ABC transporter permease subunit n=1 Tax=Phytoactinopolyspora mesophila TaxID=2650750 RepID=A0A7K3M9R2_9ACTN|nr:ABC transporter permease [Phytoactinopolyspora mesophila]NDL59737.1 ABC transporter permease subunit [Phytoactinopolyspora mesophila]
MTQQHVDEHDPSDDGSGPAAFDRKISDEPEISVAPQWKLVWWTFKRHRLAVVGGIVTIFIYLVAIFAGFLAPYSSSHFDSEYTYAPPQRLQFVDDGEWGLHVHGYVAEQDPDTLGLTWEIDESQKVPVGLFVRGEEYKILGLITWDRHLIGPKDPDGPPMYLLGADALGHDMLSRIIHATAVSMSIGLVGVVLSFLLGITLGGISGYFGGWVDNIIQRIIEFVVSIPTIPLWMGLMAAIPPHWGSLQRYFALTVILSLISWAALGREVRGKFFALRQEEFVMAATVDGASQPRIIFRHMLPSFTSHIIANMSLAIPAMILAETALSFIGIGLQSPTVSWGVLLEEAQSIRVIETAPWMMLPGIAVIVAVLSLNFFGDGLRDAADPYKH